MLRQLRRDEYTVGWVCALHVELVAAQAMLDEVHETPQIDSHDSNIYTCGRVSKHNVVIACLPDGQTGTHSAAVVATQMKLAFTSTRFSLLVGIGGGVPSKEADIRLGDVVVSKPDDVYGGVVQYDFGKATPSRFSRKGMLSKPPQILSSAVAKLRAIYWNRNGLLKHLSKFDRDAAGQDILFEAQYNHEGGTTCGKCNKDFAIAREPRRQLVEVHHGTIASGNQVMRDAAQRDRINTDLGGVLCFEMEAAGLMDHFPCLVIRGICDYADSHKNDEWQRYAAATAAAYAKEVLLVIPPIGEATQKANGIIAPPDRSIPTFTTSSNGSTTNCRNNFSGSIHGGVVNFNYGGNSTAKRHRDEDYPADRPKRARSSRGTSRTQGSHNIYDDLDDSDDSYDDTTASENSEGDNSDDDDASCSEESMGDNVDDSEEDDSESE